MKKETRFSIMVCLSLMLRFYIGDIGTIFYIIIEGQVSLRVPTTYEGHFSAEELLIYFIENMEDIDWDLFCKYQNETRVESQMTSGQALRDSVRYATSKL